MTWTGNATYDAVLTVGLAYAILAALGSLFIQSPYGRFASDRFGLELNPRLGWFLMELPASVSFALFYGLGPRRGEVVPLIFMVIWLIHYANRGFLFPWRIRAPRDARASFSLLVVAAGWAATTLHGYLNGAYFSRYGVHYTVDWLADPRFVSGLLLYYTSLGLNIHSDGILRNLRTREEVATGQRVYRIPRGGLFRYVSSPSYLTELTAWTGFAICSWSPGGVFVLAISAANLVPRSLATHRWYRQRFEDYPRRRKALIPFIL